MLDTRRSPSPCFHSFSWQTSLAYLSSYAHTRKHGQVLRNIFTRPKSWDLPSPGFTGIARNCHTLRLPGNLKLVSNPNMKFRLLCALGAAFFLALHFPASAADDPFAWPLITAQAKPWAFWWWMGSAVDKTNITRELERYAAAGLGGVHIIPIYGAKGWEDKYIKYLSPEWMNMMGWSVSEAHRLGMGVDMTTGSGWCFGGPQVTDEDANASVVVKIYEVKAGEKLNQNFDRKSTQALVAFSPGGKSIELTDKISANGEVDWTAPAFSLALNGGAGRGEGAAWTIYAISQKPSGQKVKRAGPGGEGWMLNLIYPPAMDDFLKPYTAAFAAYTGPKPRAQYHDSYEYRSDWSPNFFAEFEKRRGYRLQDELPALFGGGDALSPDSATGASQLQADHRARVLCDYRQTVSEIMAQESLPKWVKWSHEHGFLTRDQAHGSPGNWLDLYADADIHETEMFHTDRNILISKFASSAAHVAGHPLTSAETGTWLGEHFTVTLGDLKGLADDMFLAGVNHIFYHGLCYSPDEAGWPGWHFYAYTDMNPRNSIWHDVPALNEYIARVQSVLQSGQPDNDILLYWPIEDFWMQPGDKLLPQLTVHARDWFESQPIGKVAKELWEQGYQFDYVSDAQLKAAKVVDGKIQMPGGKYKFIFVPDCKYIPLATFKTLIGFAEKGATVVFEKQMPADISGGNDLKKQRTEFRKIRDQIKFAPSLLKTESKLHLTSFGEGWICIDGLAFVQSSKGTTRESFSNTGLSFVRRTFEGGKNYFIANRTQTNYDGWVSCSCCAKSFEIMNPLTGETGVAMFRQKNTDVKEVKLQLQAGESLILRVFDCVSPPMDSLRAWNYFQTNGQTAAISGDWKIKFLEGGPMLPADFSTTKLGSWTTFPDTNCQAFAGTAKYEITFDAPALHFAAQSRFFLDLGSVHQSARVRVNGKDYGALITPPFRVVVDNLKPTGNVLEVEVTSVAANRIRDLDRRGVKWKTFHDINIVDINYKPFDASNWPLTDCGLLGPVTLTPVKAE